MKTTIIMNTSNPHFGIIKFDIRGIILLVCFLLLITGCSAQHTAVAAVHSTATEVVVVSTSTQKATATATLAPTETQAPTATATPEAKCKLPEQTALKEKYKAQIYFNIDNGLGPDFGGRFPDEYLWGATGITTGEIRDTSISGLGIFTQVRVLGWGPDEQFVKYWTTIWFEPEEGSGLNDFRFYKTAMDGIYKKYILSHEAALALFEGKQLAVALGIGSGNYLSKDGVDWPTCSPGNGVLAITKDECKVGKVIYQESGDPIIRYVLHGQSVPDEQFVFGWNTMLMFDPLPFDGEMVAACAAETK